MGVGNGGVGVAVNGDYGGEAGAQVGERRNAFGDLAAVGHGGEPFDGVGLGVGAIGEVGDIGNAEPVDDGGDA